MASTILWFRDDLRTADNPALRAAAARGGPVVPVFVLDEESEGLRPLGGAARWWLHGSLEALDAALARLGPGHALPPRLVLRLGRADAVLADVARATGADAVVWNRGYTAPAIAQERAVEAAMTSRGVAVRSFQAGVLFEPWTVRTAAGSPYKVFTPYWRACLAAGEPPEPEGRPPRLIGHVPAPAGDRLDDWRLRPSAPDWAAGLRAAWTPGEAGAARRLDAFLERGLARYADDRDRPDLDGTSALSAHLRFGDIGPRQVWHAVRGWAADAGGARARSAEAFLRQLGWREFCIAMLHHWPSMTEEPWRPEFAAFPWRDDPGGLRAWRRGETGYPIVDAAMRALWATGWMHNRLRMVAASFLVKDQLVSWCHGEAWFRDTLVDADPASNVAGWQWVAGCGADAAPFFRVFNPIAQGRRFDPDGAFVRRWLPVLAGLPARYIHAPWDAPADVAARAGLRVGADYPAPVVDHARARRRAMEAFESVRRRVG